MTSEALLFAVLIGFTVLSCNSDLDDHLQKTVPTNCDTHILIDNFLYESAPNDPLFIDTLEIQGNCLRITFSASGCDGTSWEVKLIASEGVMESNPVQRNLRLSFKDVEDCNAYITQSLSFDISELQIANDDEVYLNIINTNHQILYKY